MDLTAVTKRYRDRFGIEPDVVFLVGTIEEKAAQIQRSVESSTPLLSDFEAVAERYSETFGEKPTIFDISDEVAIKLMQDAIDSGVPIPEPDVPEGALI